MKQKFKVFILSDEIDIVGVYYSYEDALADAKKYDLFNFTIVEKTLN